MGRSPTPFGTPTAASSARPGDTTYVWRSGFGIRADGNIVTVHGNALSGKTLTELLVRGGAGTGDAADIHREGPAGSQYGFREPLRRIRRA